MYNPWGATVRPEATELAEPGRLAVLDARWDADLANGDDHAVDSFCPGDVDVLGDTHAALGRGGSEVPVVYVFEDLPNIAAEAGH
ncbi:hypothetical protein AAHZ94_16830 [Streptomyces sp. HSW2009]|uniref:hypothetical protein n=1 Tax=Streptomyces sp. HSW2009 TaxID=3142890 RepID=UPI0032EAE698